MTKITQADRDAARAHDPFLWEMKPKSHEFQSLIQAFADHRKTTCMEERKAILSFIEETVDWDGVDYEKLTNWIKERGV